MTDNTKTPRDEALEKLAWLSEFAVIADDEEKRESIKEGCFAWVVNNAALFLSQEQPEPIDLEFIPRDLAAHLEWVYRDEWKNLSVGFKKTLRNWLSNKLHNLTKKDK